MIGYGNLAEYAGLIKNILKITTKIIFLDLIMQTPQGYFCEVKKLFTI
jgi:hypothetical protein